MRRAMPSAVHCGLSRHPRFLLHEPRSLVADTVLPRRVCSAACDEIDWTGSQKSIWEQVPATWDQEKTLWKTVVEACGCGGAAQAAPPLFVVLAATANLFLN